MVQINMRDQVWVCKRLHLAAKTWHWLLFNPITPKSAKDQNSIPKHELKRQNNDQSSNRVETLIF